MIGVHLNQLPIEGKHLEGEEDPAFLDLAAIGAKAAGPVRYELDVGLSGGGTQESAQSAWDQLDKLKTKR
jgi:hypothetical protein